jgi:hypothetical protein
MKPFMWRSVRSGYWCCSAERRHSTYGLSEFTAVDKSPIVAYKKWAEKGEPQ